MPNPPLEILRGIYQDACIQPSKEILVNYALFDNEKTFKSNLNGGFYYIDAHLLDNLGRQWKRHAQRLIKRIEKLGPYRAHVDQIAMALALDELKIDVTLLTAQTNFAVHVGFTKHPVVS